ncbi:chromate transporter [Paraburkholderia sp. LEh10]|jgi:chromate transporter|uniref:chromate transporter n=1 Tax=Paraburkholderia sp. LEh10 TaxID=2821353 RepID=UPI001AE94356|nr:chromate transporter [Paraburkholderia sp. LEh10]MBP0592172.1 chromate transporter [Paraburkholderia sp. LEh10]
MSDLWSTLADLAVHNVVWSLLAVGGMNATLADIQRYAVDTRHWVTSEQFVTFFSITQAAPGPNGMAVALIGFQAAGLAGALVTTVAKIVPSALVAYFVSDWVEQRNRSRVVLAIRRGLAPVTVGLLASAAWVFARETDVNVSRAMLTILTVLMVYRTRINPIWMVAAGAALGVAGMVS